MVSLKTARRVVVKIGSALLVEGGALRGPWLKSLAEDVAWLRRQGTDVVLVSSGSIALGRAGLGLGDGPLALEQAQAAAAVGQIRLARGYEENLAPHGLTAAQILVTLEDSLDRRRYLNSRATLTQLLTMGAVPIVNENDTIATDEIRYGDNDRLAAQIAVTIGADVLVLLSDVDGLYSADPRGDSAAERLALVEVITPEIEAMAGDAGTGLSKGGMKTKILAARTAQAGGAAMAITAGAPLNPLKRLEEGAPCTWFAATTDPQTARKRWIGAMKAKGSLIVDAGAARALGQGKSLLPAGVTQVLGRFGRGDPVQITGPDRPVAIGLSRYTSEEAKRIMGLRSDKIEEALGYAGRAAIVHRDDMAV